jgi:nucleotide-binding universal stress UspA family protein
MAKRILVPIDGRDEADGLVGLIADAAQAGAVVRLLHVAPVPDVVRDAEGRIVSYVDEETARLEQDAGAMLDAAAARFGGATVERAVRFGDPVTGILLESEAFGADLIAMATRRPYRLARFTLGTTADQVCRRTDVPVVVMRPAPVRP